MSNVLVWKIHEGPVSSEDLPPEYQPIDPSYNSYVVAMVSPEDNHSDWYDADIWFGSFDDAYNFMRTVEDSMEPITIGETHG